MRHNSTIRKYCISSDSLSTVHVCAISKLGIYRVLIKHGKSIDNGTYIGLGKCIRTIRYVHMYKIALRWTMVLNKSNTSVVVFGMTHVHIDYCIRKEIEHHSIHALVWSRCDALEETNHNERTAHVSTSITSLQSGRDIIL